MLVDAHLHLQDQRLDAIRPGLADVLKEKGIAHLVVNGTSMSDWAKVAACAHRFPEVIPSFGIHPWQIETHPKAWLEHLLDCLDTHGGSIGEIGLDRWRCRNNIDTQESVFLEQWNLANARKLPVTVHCLKAWGRLMALIEKNPHQGPGFLLHSYSGPKEMVEDWVALGARFSISGSFAHPRKEKKREVFNIIPRDRLLIETDAPDMALPESAQSCATPRDVDGKTINHPGNLDRVYAFAAQWLDISPLTLEKVVFANFIKMFRPVLHQSREKPGSNTCQPHQG
ncbi:MAG: TatD family hydrolase [Verrucomicrobiota bacterium]|nr:TatD family hydrolase [Verrucomicrobiota bacterium]